MLRNAEVERCSDDSSWPVLAGSTADILWGQFIISSACFGHSFERHQTENCKHKRENAGRRNASTNW